MYDCCMTKPASSRALPDRVVDLPGRARPVDPVRPANTMLPARRRRTLPSDGSGRVRVVVAGPSVHLVPVDREAEQRLLAARAQAGWGWDAKAGRRIDYFSLLLRNGAANFDSIRLLAETTGLTLEIDAAAARAIERRRRQLARDLAPIPRVIWTDEHESDREELSDRSLGRR